MDSRDSARVDSMASELKRWMKYPNPFSPPTRTYLDVVKGDSLVGYLEVRWEGNIRTTYKFTVTRVKRSGILVISSRDFWSALPDTLHVLHVFVIPWFYRGDTLLNRGYRGCPQTTIEFEVDSADTVSISVFDTHGTIVGEPYRSYLAPGKYSWCPVSAEMVSGVYFAEVKGKAEILRKEFVVVK